MDHSYIENNDIIEKYILHELSPEEDSGFEKHLLECQICRDELEYLKKIRSLAHEGILKIEQKKIKREKSKLLGIQYFYRYAATCLILVGIGFLLHRTILLKKNPAVSFNEDTTDTTSVDSVYRTPLTENDQNIEIAEKQSKETPENHDKTILAQAYETSKFFEGMIEVQYRSPAISVEFPTPAQHYSKNEKIKWKWQSNKYDSLQLVIFNNKENILFEAYIGETYMLENKLNPGLYYWQLENTKEALHIGKFTVGTKPK